MLEEKTMIYLILTMAAGILLGFLARKNRHLSHLGKAISLTIYVMLFFLGVKIGSDDMILSNLSDLGLQALVLAIAGITGSVLAAFILYRSMFRNKSDLS